MPSIEEFRKLLETDADAAFKQYSLRIDAVALDYTPQGAFDEFKRIKVAFDYVNDNGADTVVMRPNANGKEVAYLPWKNAFAGGLAKATLDGVGPAYFSTSQLDGCRFSIQYHDAGRTVVTVQHLAGDVGGPGKQGSEARDVLQQQGAQGVPPGGLQRRLSIGNGPGKFGKAGALLKADRGNTTYYDGGMAAVFGYRNKEGAWTFYSAETDSKSGTGMGLKNLVTQTTVAGPIK